MLKVVGAMLFGGCVFIASELAQSAPRRIEVSEPRIRAPRPDDAWLYRYVQFLPQP